MGFTPLGSSCFSHFCEVTAQGRTAWMCCLIETDSNSPPYINSSPSTPGPFSYLYIWSHLSKSANINIQIHMYWGWLQSELNPGSLCWDAKVLTDPPRWFLKLGTFFLCISYPLPHPCTASPHLHPRGEWFREEKMLHFLCCAKLL